MLLCRGYAELMARARKASTAVIAKPGRLDGGKHPGFRACIARDGMQLYDSTCCWCNVKCVLQVLIPNLVDL